VELAIVGEASADPRIRARKISALVMRKVHGGASQEAIAAAMGVNPSTVSRLLSEHLDKLALVMAHAGVKAVPVEAACFDPEYVRALQVLAGRAVIAQQLPTLDWED